ncbi:hypothetical protein NHJ13734_006528 [Beauveria thailandica]
MADLIRDAPLGQLLRLVSKHPTLQYPEERPNSAEFDNWACAETTTHDGTSAGAPKQHDQAADVAEAEPFAVHWYGESDPENPQNWSTGKKLTVTFIICIYTFVVYTSSAIYTNSQLGIMQEFRVGQIEATLGLSLYVLGYGVGPLLFSPLSEIPAIGRNPVYVVTMLLFVLISIPTAFAPDMRSLLVLRFFQGFFGSPCLASGGATIADMYSMETLPYAMLAWVSASYCGPALGPLLSGFSVPAMNWRWSLYEILWASVPVFAVMILLLPETNPETILFRRGKRIAKVTGKKVLYSRKQSGQQPSEGEPALLGTLFTALIKPIEITIKDPAVLFVQIYTSIIYGIYYSFFEVFPLVYPVQYGMDSGQLGLVFLCILCACLIGVLVYSLWLYLMRGCDFTTPERRLVPALFFSFGPTIGLFLFAWSARSSIHWIVPTIGITIYGSSVFVVFQCLFIYIPISYPRYAASLFAANDFFRSALACGSVLFAQPLFSNLGVARGVSVLGGLSVIGIIGIWILYYSGTKLRSMSSFAESMP